MPDNTNKTAGMYVLFISQVEFTICICISLHCFENCAYTVGRRCLDCKFVSEPVECNVVKECAGNEECYMEKYIAGGRMFYDLGCKSRNFCENNIHHAFGKRREAGVQKRGITVTCSDCCNSTDICNIGGLCGTNTVSQSHLTKYCFECPHAVSQPEECRRITTCKDGSMCMVKKTGNLYWEQGCVTKQECHSIESSGNFSCVSCCDTHFCNNECTNTPTTIQPLISTESFAKPNNVQVQISPGRHFSYAIDVKIICSAFGTPIPSFEFLFKGSALKSDMFAISNVLIIQNFQPIDDGEYTCVAKNAHGSAQKSVLLHGQ